MDNVARLPARDRAELFRETAAAKGLPPVPIEKDFWVCWTLKHLFALEDQPPLIFKGGTSLSKAYGVIERFSEDIDLAFDRAAFGFTEERDPENAPSGNAADRLIDELQGVCITHIETSLLPALQERVGDVLTEEWTLEVSRDDKQAVHFRYPPSLDNSEYGAIGYVRPQVLLELGARSDQWPAEKRIVRSYAAEEFPDFFETATCEPNTLDARRTFWEKVTLLHALQNRPNLEERHVSRQSRHYYDLYMLAQSPTRAAAIQDLDLLRRVTAHKSVFFKRGWARYTDAVNGKLRLVPHEELEKMARRDYGSMEEMFFNTPPNFDDILTELVSLEQKVNDQLAS